MATRTGVGAELLRKWERRYGLLEPERSPGGFRIYSREDERRVRLMQRHLARGYAAAEAADLARQGIVEPSPARLGRKLPQPVVARSRRLFQRALLQYDEGAAQRSIDDLFKAFTIDAVLRDAILPFLREIGESWEAGVATPGQEHFASTIIQARLLAMAQGWGTGSGPRALLACPSGERHTLGLTVFGIALSWRGWRITYLGADTPASSIADAAETTSPAIIVLAAADAQRFRAAADELATTASRHRLAIAGAGATQPLARRMGAEHLKTDPVTAAAQLAPPKENRPA